MQLTEQMLPPVVLSEQWPSLGLPDDVRHHHDPLLAADPGQERDGRELARHDGGPDQWEVRIESIDQWEESMNNIDQWGESMNSIDQ